MTKSFSPAGMAVKAFYGLGARTFGNPGGALSGNGSFNGGGGGGGGITPGPVFSAGINVAAVAIVNALDVYVVCDVASAASSHDGGNTWTIVPSAFGGEGMGGLAANPTGSVLVASSGTDAHLYRSTDQGASWGIVLDNASLGGIPVPAQFSQAGGQFYVFDNGAVTPKVWNSVTGAFGSWVSTTTPTQLSTLFGNAQNATVAVTSDGGLTGMYRSTDGATWTLALGLGGLLLAGPNALGTDGVGFAATFERSDTFRTTVEIGDITGTIWTDSGQDLPLQLPQFVVQLGAEVFVGFNTNSGHENEVCGSSDGFVTAPFVATNIDNSTGGTTIYPGGGTHVYAITQFAPGTPLYSSTDGTTWALVSLSNKGSLSRVVAGHGLAFAIGTTLAGEGTLWKLPA